MPVSREQFDADLATDLQAVSDYIVAVDAYIELSQQPDFSVEDQEVQDALAAVNAAKGRIPVPPNPQP